ncbi:MAG: hypothetical protein V4581_15255 [Bacteroidota bacterium]
MHCAVVSHSCLRQARYRQKPSLVTGLGENPDEKRYGIEITPDTLFYCVEKEGSSETYDYFYFESGGPLFADLAKQAKALFVDDYRPVDVPDAMPYQLILKLGDTLVLDKTFVMPYLEESQAQLVQQIENLRKLKIKMKRMNYHRFDGKLLTERLPEPPPVPELSKQR